MAITFLKEDLEGAQKGIAEVRQSPEFPGDCRCIKFGLCGCPAMCN